MQPFTKKPITLIYGPNSVGKSSFLHSQLLLAYLRNWNNNLNVNKTNFAGDEIDFGGFENFIHKHDTTKNITFEVAYSDENDFNRLLTPKYSEIMELHKNGFFDREITSEDIETKLESEYEESGIKLKHLIGFISIDREIRREQSYDDKNERIAALDELEFFKIALYEHDLKNQNESVLAEQFDYFAQLFDSQVEKLNESFDDLLIKAILLTEHYESEHIVSRLKFYKYLSTIHTVQFDVEMNPNASIICFINEVKLFMIQVSDYPIHQLINHIFGKQFHLATYVEHEALQEYQKITMNQRPENSHMNLFDRYNDADFSLNNFIKEFFYPQTDANQYFGPLRHYPKRSELYKIEDLGEKEDSWFAKFSASIMESNKKFLLLLALSFSILLFYRMFISPKAFYEEDYVGLIIASPFLIIAAFGIYYRLRKSDDGKIKLNSIGFRFLRDRVMSSYEAWTILHKSSDVISKLNTWLGDKSKLKSNYSIKVVKKPITNLGIIARRMGLYQPYFDSNKITKSIVNLWNYFERKLNIQQRYESQLIFTDIAKNTEVTPRDMGLGISQILPILISTFSSKESTLYLEQPELHLHPAVQMEIADEFIRSVNEQKNEFMIETHSEHLLLRIMRRMRQTAEGTLEDESLRLTPDDVCLLYVDNDDELTYLQELRLSPKGRLLDDWPRGFFEDGFRERFM